MDLQLKNTPLVNSTHLNPDLRCVDRESRLCAGTTCVGFFGARVIYSLSSSHSGPSVLRASYAFAKGKPLDSGRLRRPWETSNSPKPSRGFQPEKGRFRPPLSSPLAGSSFATPPCPPGSLSVWDQRGDFPLWTLQGKDHSPSVPAPSQASPTVNP
jgi:hypothetical protein